MSDGIVTCDACPVLCRIRPGKTGACDRYGNVDGTLRRLEPAVVLERALEKDGRLVPFAGGEWNGALLRDDPGLFDSAIDECLRMNGPGIVSFVRFAARDTEVGGTHIPRDMPVYVSPLATGFDPSAYEDPFRFDIFTNNSSPKRVVAI